MVTSISLVKVQRPWRKTYAKVLVIYAVLDEEFQALFASRIRSDFQDLNFFFLSDVWLDHPQTFVGLQKIFDNCVENSFIPKIMVFCGDFTSKSIAQGSGRDLLTYQGHSYLRTINMVE
jgi:hypothetical protein